MSVILKSWLAFAALGAGILHLALVPGSPPAIAIVLLVLGTAELGWGALVLARGVLVRAPVARGVALAPIIGWATLLLLERALGIAGLADSPALVPMSVATWFDFVIAISLTLHLRREHPAEPPAREGNPWAHLGGLFAGGLAVSVLMTPALTFTEAGLHNPHATHSPASTPLDPETIGHAGHPTKG